MSSSDGDARGRLRWVLSAGEHTDAADFGDPRIVTPYAFCVYAGSDRVSATVVLAGGGWKQVRRGGFRYKAHRSNNAAIERIWLRPGADGRTQLGVHAGGPAFELPTLPFAVGETVTVQLVNATTGTCWGAAFNPADARNTAVRFKGRGD
jgi:hypothetical protein